MVKKVYPLSATCQYTWDMIFSYRGGFDKAMSNSVQTIIKANQAPIKKTANRRKGRIEKTVPDSLKLPWAYRFISFIWEIGLVAMSIPMVLILVVLLFKALKYALGLQIK